MLSSSNEIRKPWNLNPDPWEGGAYSEDKGRKAEVLPILSWVRELLCGTRTVTRAAVTLSKGRPGPVTVEWTGWLVHNLVQGPSQIYLISGAGVPGDWSWGVQDAKCAFRGFQDAQGLRAFRDGNGTKDPSDSQTWVLIMGPELQKLASALHL